jgi:hypothetical protein
MMKGCREHYSSEKCANSALIQEHGSIVPINSFKEPLETPDEHQKPPRRTIDMDNEDEDRKSSMEGQTATCGWALRSWPGPGSAGGSCRTPMPPLAPVLLKHFVVDILTLSCGRESRRC